MSTELIIIAAIVAIMAFLSIVVIYGTKLSIEKERTKQREISVLMENINEEQIEQLKMVFSDAISATKMR